MSTDYDLWCKNRIIWRANQYKFPTLEGCFYFDQIPDHERDFFSPNDHQGDPVLLVRGNDANWTTLTTKEVLSNSNGRLTRVFLAELNHTVSICCDDDDAVLKDEANILLVGPEGIRVWSNPGAPLFALASILKMFPVGEPT